MQKSTLTRIVSELRAEISRLLADAEDHFVLIAQFMAEVNEAFGGQVFSGSEEAGAVWFYIDRPEDETDQYRLDKYGILARTRDGNHTSSEVARYGEFTCIPDEFAGAMSKRLELALRENTSQTEAISRLAGRICKPIIYVTCDRAGSESCRFLAWHADKPNLRVHGGYIESVVAGLIAQTPGRPQSWDNYTVVLRMSHPV